MRLKSLVPWLAGFALVAGCISPFAPQSRQTRAASSSPADPAPGAGGDWSVELKLVGPIVTLDRNFAPQVRKVAFFITAPAPDGAAPDTVPARSTLAKIGWWPLPAARTDAGGGLAGPPTGVTPPDTGQVFGPGLHVLQLTPPAGGGSVTARFLADFAPDAWWAGPDPDLWPASGDGDGRAVEVTDWSHFTTVPAWPPDGRGYFGPDSFLTIPSMRRPVGGDPGHRTFYEIYGNRIYARREGNTVHQNAWVVLCNGGYDKDSPYVPAVVAEDPGLPPDFAGNPAHYPVLQSKGLVGSPTGFRFRASVKLDGGMVVRFAESGTYPVFDPASVFRLPQIAGYWQAQLPGKAYLQVRAVDSDGQFGPTPTDAVSLVDLVDSGGGSPAERLARRNIVTFNIAAPARPEGIAVRTK